MSSVLDKHQQKEMINFDSLSRQQNTQISHHNQAKKQLINGNMILDEVNLQNKKGSAHEVSEVGNAVETVEDEQELQTLEVEVDLFKGIMKMTKSKKLTAIFGISGAFCIHLIIGAIYRWHMITGYVSIQYGLDRYAPIGAPLSMFCIGLTMRLGYNLSIKFGTKIILWIGVIVATLSSIIASMHTTFIQFLIFHNVIFGLGVGLIFLPPIKQCHKYFPKLKLVTNTIVLTGTGLGAVVFGAYNIECIQHDSETFMQLSQAQLYELVNSHFTICMLKMSILLFLVGALGIAMMIPMITMNETRQKQEKEMSMTVYIDEKNEGLRSKVFWTIVALIFLISCGNYYIITNFKSLLATQHHKKNFLYWILICGALGNGLSRICWGFLSSRFGFKSLFCVAVFFNILSFTIIIASNDDTLYIIFYTLNSVSLGGLMVVIPNVCLLIFGKKIGESIYSYYWIVFSLSNFFQFFITLILTNNPITSDDYSEVLVFFSLCTLASCFICYKYTFQGPWQNSSQLLEFGRKKKINP